MNAQLKSLQTDVNRFSDAILHQDRPRIQVQHSSPPQHASPGIIQVCINKSINLQ